MTNVFDQTCKIIGAALEEHKELGCGFLEAVYQEALERGFLAQEIPYKSHPAVQIVYPKYDISRLLGDMKELYEGLVKG